MTPKLVGVRLTQEAFDAVKELADSRRKRVSDVVREAVNLLLQEEGYEIHEEVGTWGGKREKSSLTK